MLWHVIEHNVLNHATVCEVRDSTEADHECANGKVCNNRVPEHGARLTVLRVNVEDASITLENCQNFTKE